MNLFQHERKNPPLQVLALGAHSDDIEIGCGGTILRIAEQHPGSHFHWVVFSGAKERRTEAARSAKLFLENSASSKVIVHNFRDSYFPAQYEKIKDAFQDLKRDINPDLVFTHCRHDLHQDHRTICELTWNGFRDHMILEYEIPKWDGDLGSPNLFVTLSKSNVKLKCEYLTEAFASQRSKRWFTEDTFRGLMRIRGIESNAASGFAEGFYCRKLIL